MRNSEWRRANGWACLGRTRVPSNRVQMCAGFIWVAWANLFARVFSQMPTGKLLLAHATLQAPDCAWSLSDEAPIGQSTAGRDGGYMVLTIVVLNDNRLPVERETEVAVVDCLSK